jgi:hypothetical protein
MDGLRRAHSAQGTSENSKPGLMIFDAKSAADVDEVDGVAIRAQLANQIGHPTHSLAKGATSVIWEPM